MSEQRVFRCNRKPVMRGEQFYVEHCVYLLLSDGKNVYMCSGNSYVPPEIRCKGYRYTRLVPILLGMYNFWTCLNIKSGWKHRRNLRTVEKTIILFKGAIIAVEYVSKQFHPVYPYRFRVRDGCGCSSKDDFRCGFRTFIRSTAFPWFAFFRWIFVSLTFSLSPFAYVTTLFGGSPCIQTKKSLSFIDLSDKWHSTIFIVFKIACHNFESCCTVTSHRITLKQMTNSLVTCTKYTSVRISRVSPEWQEISLKSPTTPFSHSLPWNKWRMCDLCEINGPYLAVRF